DRPHLRRLPSRVRDPVRRVHLPRLRPDHDPAREAALPHRGDPHRPGRHPRALRRRHRRDRAPQRIARGALRPHRRPARRHPFEPKARYWDRGEVPTGASDADLGISERVTTPAGIAQLQSARILRAGTDLTIAAYGPTVRTALMVADVAAEEGTDIEVIDLRSISPIDFETVTASVRKTGRLVVAHEAPVFFGAGAEIAARVSQECFYHLEAPVARVGGFHTPYPVSKVEEEYLPGLDRVLHAVEESMAY